MSEEKYPFISEEEKRKIARNRTPTERFDLLMRLIRIDRMLKQAKIVHQINDFKKGLID
ncbi:MAG TPA: hypothetical protein VFJ43_00775 [Bacteroidia bacterium]|nr:hypothetical protein [Bacteroidia bacterium]